MRQFSLLVRRTQVKLSAKDDLQLEAATHKALENAVQPSTDTSSILHAILSQTSTAPKKSTPVKKVITLPPPLVPISSLTATSTTPAPVIKEEPYDASYEVVNIKPEPLDPPGEDEYVLPDTERLVDVKEEPVDEEEVVDQEDMEELVEEEDMEVTVDPMMFLYKEDSSDVTIVKQEVESTKLPSPAKSPAKPKAGSIVVKSLEHLKDLKVTKKKTVYDRRKNGRAKPEAPAKSPAKSKAGSIVVKSLEHLKDLKVTKKKTVYDRRKNGPKPYQCAICPRGYYSDIGLQNHLWSHRKILKNSNVVNRDEEKVNWKKTKITASNLLSYNNAMFSSGTRYQCPLCNKKINTKSNLRRHLQAHKPKGKHTCEICFRM
ncbi:zinc finger and SCAN domain-containing protein 31-like [Diaphorina citri]|uniref:Zinc finger and SCAN domain-containing protein 31-like n=1 Tax=Diaphorina citri TaxID=121845 RepID=A0A3Q0INU2_DIACI|nr:zinc finger and SCAN domain-containing protein 31-like [Diaphorina citri]